MQMKQVWSGMVMLLVIISAASTSSVAAFQDETAAADDDLFKTYRQAFIFEGPGETYTITGNIEEGREVKVVERNHTGTWIRVQILSVDGFVLLDGWMISGFLEGQREGLQFSVVPENSDIPDAVPANASGATIRELYAAPVLPRISEAMIDVYEGGQELGNYDQIITKVGDSVVANEFYLLPLARTDEALGPYDYLAETVDFFGPGVSESIAARIGLSSVVVHDPFWARDERCEPNETPLQCEYRIKQPSVAFVMFGPNDVRTISPEEFANNLTQIVEESLARGIIPVLITFSSSPNEAYFDRSIDFNNALVGVGAAFDVPVINFWSASRILPDYGLDNDLVHLTQSGFENLRYDSGYEAWSGVSLLNLLSIRTLDEIRRTVGMDGCPPPDDDDTEAECAEG
jgi:hypothetical protein